MSGHLDGDLYGLAGDGVTDNSAGLKVIRDTVRRLDRDWIINLDPGHYCYSDNTWWLFGDRRVTILANGSKLECVSPEAWDRGWGLLPPMSPAEFWTGSPYDPANATVPPGTRFASVQAGADTIELFGSALPPLVPGELVLLAGHIQQIREVEGEPEAWGWPANQAIFEYARIAKADDTLVTLQGRLRHAYNAGWPEWEHNPLEGVTRLYGAPRLFRTRFPDWTLTRDLRVERAVFVANRHKPYTPLNFSGYRIALDRCSTEGDVFLHMQHCEDFDATLCDFGNCELDKLIRRVRFDRCTFRGSLTGHGGGWESVEVRDCDVMGDEHGRGIELAGRDARFAGTTVAHGRVTFHNPPETTVAGPIILSGAG